LFHRGIKGIHIDMYDLSQDSSFITDIRDKPLRRFMKPITAL